MKSLEFRRKGTETPTEENEISDLLFSLLKESFVILNWLFFNFPFTTDIGFNHNVSRDAPGIESAYV